MNVPDTHPLLLSNLIGKAQPSADAYLRSSIGVIDGYGTKGAKNRPFRQDIAVRRFSDWVYAASLLVAQSVASASLRLYVRRKGTQRPIYNTRAVGRRAKSYLRGDRMDRPSRTVLAKVAEFGDDFEEVTEPHPALKVLQDANPWQNGFEQTVLKFIYLQLAGNAYLHPVFGESGIPVETWLMPSQWMRVIPGRREDNVLIKGWFYGRPGSENEFAADEVIQWRLPSIAGQQSDTDVLYYGKGKAEAAWSALNLHDAKRVQDQARYDNFSRPDWLVGIEGATGQALREVEAAIEQRLRGVQNTGKMLATNGKVTAQALNLPDPDVGDSEKIVQEIASIFGVPLYKLLGNDPVKANSEVQDVSFLRDTVLPFLRMDEEQLNAKWLPLFGIENDAVLAYDNPISENAAAQVDRLTKLVGGSVMMVNEARSEEGLDAVDGGDTILIPSTSVPLGMAGKFPATPAAGLFGSPNPSTAPSPTPAPASQPAAVPILSPDVLKFALDIVGQVMAATLPRDSGLALMVAAGVPTDKATAIMGTAGQSKPDAAPPAAVPIPPVKSKAIKAKYAAPPPDGSAMIPALRGIFARQASEILGRIASKAVVTKDDDDDRNDSPLKPSAPKTPKIDLSNWDTPLAEAVAPMMDKIARAGVDAMKQVLTDAGVKEEVFRVVDANLPKAVEELSLKFAQSTNATTSLEIDDALEKLRTEVDQGIVSGDTVAEMKARVQTVFDRASDSRAETIARTEATRARHSAEQMTAKESGVVKTKSWLASPDACPYCDEMAAKGPIPLDDSFTSDSYGDVDAPPRHPNCTCSVTYGLSDE